MADTSDREFARIVLAAGASSRFGSPKPLAPFKGRPVLEHVLSVARGAGLAEIVVVLGETARQVETAVAWQHERRVRNPDPERGLSSSVRVGLDALGPGIDAALILLGDQPLVRADVIAAILAAGREGGHPIVVPEYAGGGGPNPVLIARSAWGLAGTLSGDRGLGPIIAGDPSRVHRVRVAGTNPDIDTPADLARLAEEDWARRVRANREQVERIREVPDEADFYAPVTSLFRADPRRTDEPALERLRSLARPGETWLDIGAGAGRYALPLALIAREVIAVDPSAGMLTALEEQMAEYGISNVRRIAGRWPPDEALSATIGPFPSADVALIAHVGYDIEEIGPFVEAMESAARRLCVAVLMERQPSSVADVFWPAVHGEERVALPALPDFVALLESRAMRPAVMGFERESRRFELRGDLERFVRRQLWIAEGGPKDIRFRAALDRLAVEREGGWALEHQPAPPIGVVTWQPSLAVPPSPSSFG